MAQQHDDAVVGQIVEEHSTVTVTQLCRSCGVRAEWVDLLVEEGVLEPAEHSGQTGQEFPVELLPRVHKAVRLERDLGLNISGVALALELMDEIRSLKRRLDALSER